MAIPSAALEGMQSASPTERPKLLEFWQQLTQLHRHEDNLLNSRLQAFLVTTAFLVGAFSQFRDMSGFATIMRTLIAIFGAVLAWIMRGVLIRTSTAIEWYRERLTFLDGLLFAEWLQPYGTRQKEKQSAPKSHLSRTLSSSIPTMVVSLWILLGLCGLFPLFRALAKWLCR
jgi:hypothetical protein